MVGVRRDTTPLLLQQLLGDPQILYKAQAPVVHHLRHLCRLFVQYIPRCSTVYLTTHNCTLSIFFLFLFLYFLGVTPSFVLS